ncbi:unnamed protein product [Diplocarpon coronariae]
MKVVIRVATPLFRDGCSGTGADVGLRAAATDTEGEDTDEWPLQSRWLNRPLNGSPHEQKRRSDLQAVVVNHATKTIKRGRHPPPLSTTRILLTQPKVGHHPAPPPSDLVPPTTSQRVTPSPSDQSRPPSPLSPGPETSRPVQRPTPVSVAVLPLLHRGGRGANEHIAFPEPSPPVPPPPPSRKPDARTSCPGVGGQGRGARPASVLGSVALAVPARRGDVRALLADGRGARQGRASEERALPSRTLDGRRLAGADLGAGGGEIQPVCKCSSWTLALQGKFGCLDASVVNDLAPSSGILTTISGDQDMEWAWSVEVKREPMDTYSFPSLLSHGRRPGGYPRSGNIDSTLHLVFHRRNVREAVWTGRPATALSSETSHAKKAAPWQTHLEHRARVRFHVETPDTSFLARLENSHLSVLSLPGF